jgi:hypothetical protein
MMKKNSDAKADKGKRCIFPDSARPSFESFSRNRLVGFDLYVADSSFAVCCIIYVKQ